LGAALVVYAALQAGTPLLGQESAGTAPLPLPPAKDAGNFRTEKIDRPDPAAAPKAMAYGEIAGRLDGMLATRPLSNWFRPTPAERSASPRTFSRSIGDARARSDPGECLRLSLSDLAAHASGGDFPRRLWEAAGYADWMERARPGSIDPAVCSALLDLCDALPPGDVYRIEGKFLRAKRFARAGNRSGEQEALGEVVALPNLSVDFLAPACRMLGASLESTGDYRGALETYELLETAADRYSSAADCLMSAVMIDLRLGNIDEAVRLVRILQEAPEEVVRGAASAARIREFVRLVKEGRTPSLPVTRNTRPLLVDLPAHPPPDDFAGRWLASISLPWYDLAGPSSLDDPALKGAEGALGPAGRVKLLLLESRNSSLPVERRRAAFREALRRLLESSPDIQRLNALAASVVDNPGFDLETRMETLQGTLAILSEEGRPREYGAWRRNPIASGFSPEFLAKADLLDREANLDRSSPAAILGLADDVRAGPMTPFAVLTMRDLLGFLLRLGDIGSAERLVSAIPSWSPPTGASEGADDVSGEFERSVRLAGYTNPVHEALAAALLARVGGTGNGLPREYLNLRLESAVPERGPAATFQACRYLVATRRFSRDNLLFWGVVLRSLPRDANQASIVGELLRSGLKAAPDDQLRSELIVLFFTSVDIDDPAVRGAIEREFAVYRRPAECPLSCFVIRLYEIHRDLRLGSSGGLEPAFAGLADPRAGMIRQRTCVRSYTELGERENLRRTLEGMDEGSLFSPGFLAQAIPAFQLLGMRRELGIAVDSARRALRDAVVDSWMRRNEASGNAALDLALAIGDPSALPAAWVADMGSGGGDPLFQGRARLVEAYLQADWGLVEREAAALNRDYPANYSYYWYRGLALHNLGRDGEAVTALSLYTLHARDELEYPRAVALLQSMGTSLPHSAAGAAQ